MKQIIQAITMEYTKNVMKYFEEHGIHDLGEMADEMLGRAKSLASEMITSFIEYADTALVAAKAERRSDGIRIHERDVPRTLQTALGSITYKRTYFDMQGEGVYLIDDLLGINPYERVDAHLSAKMVNEASRMSFGRSSDIVTGGAVSRQTAWRKANETGEVVALPPVAKITPERIHIFADEDHVDMQDGKNTILPLITICEGKVPVCKGRNELIDPIHLNGYGLSSEKRWEYAYAILESKYDMSKIREVYIYGDGAPWIMTSDSCFPNAIRILDSYHFEQRMRGICAGEICSPYSQRLRGAVSNNRKDTFQKLIYEMENAVSEGMPPGKQRIGRLKSILECGGYLLGHWEAVQNMKLDGSIGSCTEALVSHVFSERFSRNPMGWSKNGLAKMSMIRVFVKNGGVVTACDIGKDKRDPEERLLVQGRIGKYEELVRRQQEKVFEGVKNWRWFEPERSGCIRPSGTKVALVALGKVRKIY